ncbi:universal stress protein [Streptomyces roseicoloratus]|uniref:Universal stress protein n=1 Tax=Streptomyces roseicoloratus TaxID=2508722 RepID=A0ABY9S3K4_9ACTN|nr:universal stress protein [Streptomyces roseicoloratus]WMX48604.1 universal stress protein [Streptomyces roseicoloratus]
MSEKSAVVVGVDGSEHSLRALEWALRTARSLEAPLTVAHVRPEELQLGSARIASLGPGPELPDTVVDALAAQVGPRAEGIDVRYASLDGSVVDALAEAARGARLLVVGSRGRGGFASLLVGSNSRALAASAPCPVVVVPHEARAASLESGAEAGRVLLGLHIEETADEVVDFAFEAARRRKVPLEVVTAYPVPPSPALLIGAPAPALQVPPPLPDETPELVDTTTRRQEERLRPFAERHPEVEVIPAVTPADAAARLVEDSAEAGLLVVGRHRRHRVETLLVGSVAHAVLHHAACPVAVVPPAQKR